MRPMRPVLHILRLRGVPIFEQLCLEEALFRADRRNWLVLNQGCPQPAIVMGISGVAETLVFTEAAQLAGVQVIRRYTGGGCVITDEGTVFASLLCNKDEARGAPQYPRELMKWSHDELYSPIFRRFFGRRGEGFSLREHDYCVGDTKVGGNAQTISRDRWVHHTSFLWTFSEARMALLRMPSKRPDYRLDRPHGSFLAPLQSFAAPGQLPGEFMDAIVQHLGVSLFHTVEASLGEALAVQASSRERQATHQVPLLPALQHPQHDLIPVLVASSAQ